MKLFIKNILKFLLALILFIAVSFFVIISITKLNDKNIFKFNKSKKILLLGDSQIECALNDSIVENSVNVASAADVYLFSYIKLRAYTKYNPNIKTVVLGLSYHNLLKSLEEEWLDDIHVQAKLAKYAYLMNYSEISEIIKKYPISVLKSSIEIYKGLIITMIKSLVYKNYKKFNYGRFVPLKRDKIKQAIAWSTNKPRKIEYSNIQIKYLLKIADYCQKHKIKLILLTSPLHPVYVKNKITERKALDNFISKNFKGCQYLDFSTFKLSDDSFYADTWHLKYNGAKLFSQYLNKILTR